SHEQVLPPSTSTNARLVRLDQMGLGGGGGGGGNRSQSPPRPAQARGRDPVSAPAATPRVLDPPALTPNEPEPVRQVTIPAQSLAGAPETLAGAIDGLGAPAPPAQG